MADAPITCTLTPADLDARREALVPGLIGRADQIEWLEDGCRLQFSASAEMLHRIANVIDAERQCCKFLRFELAIAPSLGPMTLTVRGPQGTVEILRSLLT